MSSTLAPNVKAGRLLRLLGWINLCFTIVVGAAMLIPSLEDGDPLSVSAVGLLALGVAVCVGYLVVGGALKRNASWAKPVGVAVAFLSLLNVPIGTVIGIIALVYLARCRNEPAAAA